MKKVIIELKNVSLRYDDDPENPIVNNINLQIYENEFVTLLGPSGCGKTTTLRMIAGFQTPTEGEVIIDGKVFNDIPPYARPINTVFQRYALFPHLNVIDNVKIGLNNRPLKNLIEFFGGEEKILNEIKEDKLAKGLSEEKASKVNRFEINKKINEYIDKAAKDALALVKLTDKANRKIDQMSGGQQQRVAIARAIINKPKILLLDEPLAALDLKLRQNMQYELKEMQRALGITFIFVTHDQEEAMTMSDRVVVMQDGIIQQLGTPEDIYNEPVNPFVANFIGETNIVRGTYLEENLIEFLGVEFPIQGYKFEDGEKVDVVIRPEDWDVVPLDQAKLVGTVTSRIFKGVHYEICAMFGEKEIVIHAYETPNIGDKIGLKVDPYEIHLMKVDPEEEVESNEEEVDE
ncbi:MAG: ABC transporter ATP-binding protein [Erysipelotrichaceae bacterium]|nr:ABC transporter ATP-binding protein [Erysipelotrichaceae bacterium]